jgi:acyl carrier protein
MDSQKIEQRVRKIISKISGTDEDNIILEEPLDKYVASLRKLRNALSIEFPVVILTEESEAWEKVKDVVVTVLGKAAQREN